MTRRRIVSTIAVVAALSLGGVAVAPFAAATETSGTGRTSVMQRWLDFWRGGDASGGGLPRAGAVRSGSLIGGAVQADDGTARAATSRGSATRSSAAGRKSAASSRSGGSGSGSSRSSGSTAGSGSGSGRCADVEVVFARGTGERSGLGILGAPLGRALQQRLPGRSVKSTGVDYAADFSQRSAGPGATTMARYVTSVAKKCPKTRFVIGGYSQGATVTSIAVGAQGSRVLGRGETIPSNLSKRVAAVVVFGNPLSGFGGRTLEQAGTSVSGRTRSFCGEADRICGGSRFGNVSGGHLSYRSNGAVDTAAAFAAKKLK